MKNIVELQILGHRLVIKSGEDKEYIAKVEEYLNEKLEEVKSGTKSVSTLDLSLLAALNIAGEYIKTKEVLDRLGVKAEELAQLIDRKVA